MQRITTRLSITFLLFTFYSICQGTEEQHHNSKRAPLGFTGVRGKKSIPDTEISDNNNINNNNNNNEIDKRAPSGFMGMRGKKPYSFLWNNYPEDMLLKRAPSGFMGMRGKKDMELPNFAEDYLKRAPSSLGFMGMRGKKDELTQQFYNDKRGPNNFGFVGMRGKKEWDFISPPEQQQQQQQPLQLIGEEKRAPSVGFFGMRGKKQPRQSGFFGMRGKKYPYEFRGKFVGVRGKKSAINSNDLYNNFNENRYPDMASVSQDLDINQLMLLLTENDAVAAAAATNAEQEPGWNGDYSQN